MIATSKVASETPNATAIFTLPVKYITSTKHVVIYIYGFCKLITNSLITLLKIYENLELTNVQCVKSETM